MSKEDYGMHCVQQLERLFETEYNGIWDPKIQLINPTLFPPGSTHSTFASNPLGTAVGLETMKMLAETDYESLVDIGLAGELEYKGRQTGLVLDIGGYYKDVITFAPSLHISSDEIDHGLSLLEQLLTMANH